MTQLEIQPPALSLQVQDQSDVLADVLAAYARLGYLVSGCQSARALAAYNGGGRGPAWLMQAEVALAEARVSLSTLVGITFAASEATPIAAYEGLIRHLEHELSIVVDWLQHAVATDGQWTSDEVRCLGDARHALTEAQESLAHVA